VDKLQTADASAFRFAAGAFAVEPGEGKRRFAGVAYSGKEVTDHPFWPKVIFDLSTTRSEARLGALLNHDPDKIVGHTEGVEIGSDIKVSGFLYADEADGGLVAKRSDAGFPWQMSVHIVPGQIEEIRGGATIQVNGEQFAGPGYVFRNSRIREVSFVPVGADDKTHAVALSAHQPHPEKKHMSITQEQHDAVVAENTALRAQVAELTEKVSTFTAAQAQAAKDARIVAVKALFSATGREFTDEAAKPYIEMTAEHFTAVEKDMRAAKPTAPSYLFSEKAKGDLQGKSPLVADAERRAAAAQGK